MQSMPTLLSMMPVQIISPLSGAMTAMGQARNEPTFASVKL